MRATPLSILIVEDNQSDAELVLEGLRGSPAKPNVEVFKDGHAALARLREGGLATDLQRPDLVLLDLNLPGLSGFDTLAQIKADDQLRSIPVVVLTTSRSSREIARSYKQGAAAVLNKPMRLAAYREMLQAFATFWFEHVQLPVHER